MRSKDVLQLLRVTRQTLSKYDENSEEKPRERREQIAQQFAAEPLMRL